MDIIGFIIDNILLLILLADVFLILVMVFWERNDPQTVLLWIIVLGVIPIVGFFLYLFLGQSFYSERAFRNKAAKDREFEDAILAEVKESVSKIMDNELAEHPENGKKLRFANAMTKAGSELYTNSNDVRFMSESQTYFDNLLKDLADAKETINFEYYIIRNDEVSNRLMDILTDRVKNGVEVRLMIDAIGNNKGPKKKIREFKAAGGKFSLFHSTATCLLSPRKNNRNHRKIAVIDGTVAYVGGFNIGDEYLGKGPLGFWRDSAVRIEGPEVLDAQVRFLVDWRYATDENAVFEMKFYPDIMKMVSKGEDSIQLISGGPDVAYFNPIQLQYLNMFLSAEKTLYIHTPYLGPDAALLETLRNSALLGVDVRVIIPDVGDHPFVYWANRYYANTLMEQGVKIYEFHNGFVHSKTMVADGYYCSVGSANLDERSVKLNFETNAMIYSSRIGKEMDDAFMKDLERCTEYTREMYAQRTFFQRFKTGISRLVAGQL
jgi:cardiolipin synthase